MCASRDEQNKRCATRCGDGFALKPACRGIDSQTKDLNMKRILASIIGLGVISLGLVGCGDTASTKTETKMSTPGGTTTVTTEKEVKKTGDNPPASHP